MNLLGAPEESRLARTIRRLIELLAFAASAIAPPLSRIALALPFIRSGFTRWDGFLSLSAGTTYLFEESFKLHVFGSVYDLPAPDFLALLVAVAEIMLPIMLVFGFATRLAALALLVMTGVIQLIFPEGWANFHLYWAALAIAVIAFGPGKLSIDHLLDVWLRRSRSR